MPHFCARRTRCACPAMPAAAGYQFARAPRRRAMRSRCRAAELAVASGRTWRPRSPPAPRRPGWRRPRARLATWAEHARCRALWPRAADSGGIPSTRLPARSRYSAPQRRFRERIGVARADFAGFGWIRPPRRCRAAGGAVASGHARDGGRACAGGAGAAVVVPRGSRSRGKAGRGEQREAVQERLHGKRECLAWTPVRVKACRPAGACGWEQRPRSTAWKWWQPSRWQEGPPGDRTTGRNGPEIGRER